MDLGLKGKVALVTAASKGMGKASALGLAANATGGLNEWPYSGGDEMFFHPGFAARNAVTAVELAELGDGLFHGRARRAASTVRHRGWD